MNRSNEDIYKELLLSAKWDVRDAPAPRLRYAILSLPRTGSELLCGRLRLEGIGIPLEYFNTQVIAARLGCVDAAGGVDVPRYLERLEAVRTTPNGVFGAKIQPRHLMTLGGGDTALALSLLRRFDKIVVLRRGDVLLQAISLARSHLTGQWHLLPGDNVRHVSVDDERLFETIVHSIERIRNAERLLGEVERTFAAERVRAAEYECFITPDALQSLVDWIGNGFQRSPRATGPTPDLTLPRRGDEGEAEAIKRRFLIRYPSLNPVR